MPKHRRPAYYAAPLRRRADIVAFLMGHDSYYRFPPSDSFPLAWNVRAYGVDLSPEHLIETYRTSGEYGPDERWLDYPEWRMPALAVYREFKDRLWYWAIEVARDMVVDSDCYRSLWDGTELDVRYAFAGRSGGWLVITDYAGYAFRGWGHDAFREFLETRSYKTLRDLYQLVVQNDHDFRREAAEAEIEYRAAEAWIVNCCADVPRPDRTQAELPLAGAL